MSESTLTVGSKGASSAQKTQPRTTSVRHTQGTHPWFVPSGDNKGALCMFPSGIMFDPKFNPKAAIIDVSCGFGRISESDATGVLSILENPMMPEDAVRTCRLGYDTKRKVFYDTENPNVIFTAADYLVLNNDGSAQVGWKK